MKHILVCAGILALLIPSPAEARTVVRYDTVMGSFYVQFYNDITPGTVANFLNYARDGDYVNSFFHRNAWNDNSPAPSTPFVIQGGGYTVTAADTALGWQLSGVPADAPIVNEFQVSNTRGTIAMAKLGGNPDSATREWFFNMSDNSANLDNQNGGFTVFGEVLGNGMSVLDAVSLLGPFDFSSPFDNLPLRGYTQADYDAGADPDLEDFIRITNLVPLGDANADGFADEADFAILAAGYGQAFAGAASWQSGDFNSDGVVNVGDLGILAFFYSPAVGGGAGGSPPHAPGAVPEPTAMSMIVLGGLALLRRRGR